MGGPRIHPSALIDPGAELADSVTVGPFSIIEADAIIGPETEIGANVVIRSHTEIGARCKIHTGSVLGEPPQDLKYHGEHSRLVIGDDNLIREYVTFHRATGEGAATVIGNSNLLMAYCHIGHNCHVGDHVQMANFSGLAGHVEVADRVVLGALCGVHQYVRVGPLAMLGGYSKVVQDVPPYVMVDGRPAEVKGLNYRGLQRAGMSQEARSALRRAHRILFRSPLNTSDAIAKVEAEIEQLPEVVHLIEFIRASGEGYCGRRNDPLGRRR